MPKKEGINRLVKRGKGTRGVLNTARKHYLKIIQVVPSKGISAKVRHNYFKTFLFLIFSFFKPFRR